MIVGGGKAGGKQGSAVLVAVCRHFPPPVSVAVQCS